MPLNKFIKAINEQIAGIAPNAKLFGIAKKITRTSGTVTESLPGIVNDKGEITYVGVDDLYPLLVYHKQSRIAVTRQAGSGFGNSVGLNVNTYQLSMIIFLDYTKVKVMPEEFLLYLQANIADAIKGIKPYRIVLVRLNSVNLDSDQVLRQEYEGANFKLPAEKFLFQVDYTIESRFDHECFEKCPEGLTC